MTPILRPHSRLKLANGSDSFERCVNFLTESYADGVLDIIELTFRVIEKVIPSNRQIKPKTSAESAIAELNHRFREHGIGYEYVQGEIIKVTSKFAHKEITIPALKLLSDEEFGGASDEFLKAHEFYRHDNYKSCVNEALKSFESTMKTICKRLNWDYDGNYTSSKLINVIISNELVPNSMTTQLGAIRSLLESGLPTIRNKNSGHGQGEEKVIIPESLAKYALHMAATNIIFLVDQYKIKKVIN